MNLSRKTMRNMMLVTCALLAGGAWAKDRPGSRAGQPWHGGKVRAPIEVKATGHGAVDPSRDVAVTLEATSQGDCDPLSLTVSGTNAVEVKGGEARSHGRLDLGQKETRTVTVRVPPGRGGYLVVSARCGSGEAARVTVVNFPLYAKGVDPKQSADLNEKPQGELTTGAEGQPVILLPTTP